MSVSPVVGEFLVGKLGEAAVAETERVRDLVHRAGLGVGFATFDLGELAGADLGVLSESRSAGAERFAAATDRSADCDEFGVFGHTSRVPIRSRSRTAPAPSEERDGDG